MTEIEHMLQRAKIDSILNDLDINEQNKILKDIEELKSILKSESLSLESIALLLYFSKNYKRKEK